MDSVLTSKSFADCMMVGTTCRPHVSLQWISEDDRFVLMHHESHHGYYNRCTGRSVTCATYRALYDLWQKGNSDSRLAKEMKTWKGRWSKSNHIEMLGLIADLVHEENGPATGFRSYDSIARNAKRLMHGFLHGRKEQPVIDHLNNLRDQSAGIVDDLDRLIEWHRERGTK